MKALHYDKKSLEKDLQAGSIISIHKNAVSADVKGSLISFLPQDRHRGPGCIILPRRDFSILVKKLSCGIPFIFSDNSISFIEIDDPDLYICFKNSNSFDCKSLAVSIFSNLSFNNTLFIDNMSFLLKHLSSAQYFCGSLFHMMYQCKNYIIPNSFSSWADSRTIPGWQDYICNILRDTADSIHKRDEKMFIRQIEKLIGLGFGLTPAGDDFILGMLAASTLLKDYYAAGSLDFLHESLQKTVPNLLDKTNFISAGYLKYAIEGCFSETLISLTAQLVSEKLTSDNKNLTKLLQYGASSGLDILGGLLFPFLNS